MEEEFRLRIREYLEENVRKISTAWALLDEQRMWWRPNEQCLAPANQLIHLSGNLRQWVLSHLAGQQDVREREAEFAARQGAGHTELLSQFLALMQEVLLVLEAPIDHRRRLRVQGHDTTPVGVWIHMTEHLSYHTGQLLYTVKQLSGQSFDFYADWALDDVG